MMDKRVLKISCLLLIVFLVAISTSSCDLPIPSPRQAQAPATTEATAAPTVESGNEITQTIALAAVPTNTPIILVLPTDTPARPTATATKVVAYEPVTTTVSLTETEASSIMTSIDVLTDTLMTAVTPQTIEQISTPVSSAGATMEPARASGARSTATTLPGPTATKKALPTTKPTATKAAPLAKSESSPEPTLPTQAVTSTMETGNVILNGDFESGFDEFGIGNEWQGFDKVTGVYGWSDETWPGLVADGQHAQMMRITFTSDPDQYIGIQQTIPVVKGEPYELTLHGLIRSAEGNVEASNWGYRIEWGIDVKGRDSWEVVEDWYDTGWNDQPLDAETYTINEHKATITPPGDTLTLFIRGWRKWGTQDREVDFVIDGVSLVGPVQTGGGPSKLPATGGFNTWLISLIAGLGLVVLILTLRQARKRFATNS